ncbi:hypothetical protein BS78_K310400 [Paspalum vaginatum]|uniref:Rx N-terminal domain-containing protein n=1 Tax=Paspalum vaginatum TaxID=158149 RepID=A0A9W7XAS3_9POAL|nr:hypothetical protein BS78_K310400 [Paspalum vaginatum]
MAELALGLTKTVVEGALGRIQWAIDEEQKLQDGVQQDLEFITGEFQMMQSFLKVANKERAKKNEVVRAWVRQLRDLAFDVEDWVEFVAHLDRDEQPSWGWRLVPWFCCVPTPPRHLDEAAAEMKLLKARVEDVSKRNTRYKLFGSDYSGSGSSSASNAMMRPTTLNVPFNILRQVWMNETNRLRFVGGLQNLITHELRGNDDLQVIWLWGSENHDVSYCIDMAYHDQEVCKWFDRRAWVKITSPFNLQDLLNNLLAQLSFMGSSHKPAATATNVGGLTSAELMQQVTKDQRYLVVLEQVSDLVEWSTIRMCLPDNNKGSRIVVSTLHLRDAVFCTGVPYLVSELRWFFDGRPSVCAFYKKVAGQSDSDMDMIMGKIKHGGVISVLGDDPRKSKVVKMLYRSIQQNEGKLDGVRFGYTRWVPVVGEPFELVDFSRRVLLDLYNYGFYDGGLQELFDIFGGNVFEDVLHKMGEDDVIHRSREILIGGEKQSLVVINGLRSKDEWDKIKSNILPEEPGKYCAVVVTDDKDVASHCADGVEDRLVEVKGIDIHMPPGPYTLVDVNGSLIGSDTSLIVISKKYLAIRHYFWVDVPHPFSLAELSLRLLMELHSDYPEAKETAMVAKVQGKDLIHECRVWLHQHAGWLLVLDGLRSTDDWDSVNDALSLSQPAYSNNRTIVVTNEQSVAMHCVNKNDQQVVSVQGLETDDALQLFKLKIHNNNTDMEPSEKELSQSIMVKCGGLPKVIAAVAEWYNKSFNKRSYLKLKDINDNFMEKLEGFHSLRGLFSWMQSYLENCRDDLKPCIFYLPIFPIGHNIRFRRLLWRWIAEGYFRGTSSHTEEENGGRLLKELWEFSMIQLQSSRKPDQCQVNGFFHEYITSRPMEDNLVLALEGNCNLSSQQVGQHLTIRNMDDTDKNVYESTDFSRLRSVTVFGKCRPFMFDPEKIKMRHVRVLDLEDALEVSNADIDNIVELLPRLKFLSIRRCRDVTRLPMSISGLKQLQTLDVRDTLIARLPEAILRLQKLQYVRAGTIHTAPWDEGGKMVECPLEAPGQDAPTASTPLAEDAPVNIAPAQKAPTEDAATVTATPLASADQSTTLAAPTTPLDDVITAFSTAPTENAKMVAPTMPVEDVVIDSSTAPPEDATVAVASPTAVAEDATVVYGGPTAPAQDSGPPAPLAPAENDAVTLAADPSALSASEDPREATAVLASDDPSAGAAAAPWSRFHALVPWWQHFKLCCPPRIDNTSSQGVEVPAGFGKLTTLHTFGIANVGPCRKAVILKELHKLTQLRRLGVCGIKQDNIQELFSAIAVLNHLEQLSVFLEKNKEGLCVSFDGTVALPPDTLELLKLHGHLRILRLPDSWIKKFVQVERLDLQVTLQEQQDMQVILDQLIGPRKDEFYWSGRSILCIKPIHGGELRIGIDDEHKSMYLDVLEIVCTSDLQVTFGNIGAIDMLRVHCCSGSSLQLSGLQTIGSIKEVWLKGSYSKELKLDLQRQLAKNRCKPVLKEFQPKPSS